MATVILHAHAPASDLPLVLLPPFPLDARLWQPVRDLLPGDVITVDPPGFGGAVDDSPALEGYARALLSALDARGVGRFVVAGNSMGGYTALALAEIAPERIAGIGLVGTKSTADDEEARGNRFAMADAADADEPVSGLLAGLLGRIVSDGTRSEQPDTVARLEAWFADAPASGFAWAQRAMAGRPDRTGVLAALAGRGSGVPGLVVHGSEDTICDAASHRTMADALGVGVRTVARRGHLVPLEEPATVAGALTDLWNRAAARV